jgi:7-cyano-7-deazaguanine synthase
MHPVYIAVGLAWEAAERAIVSSFLARAPLKGHARPLVSLGVDMRDVYAATHWAMEGRPPAYHTPDEDVYLPGRNVILFGKAAVYCAAAKIDRLVIGTLAHNPFPDATPEFRATLARALSLGLDRPLEIDAPYANSNKADVIRRGAALGVPFELTLSCMNPPAPASAISHQSSAIHCGACSKCRERHDAFVEAGIPDPTTYHTTVNLR